MSAFTATKTVPERPAVMGRYKPYWIEKPDGDDMSSFYPAHAERHHINGRANLKCLVGLDGRLADCRVLSEAPRGEGFGAAAIALSAKFRMLPPDSSVGPGLPQITVPIVFEIPNYNRRSAPKPQGAEIKPATTGVQALIGGKAQEGLLTKVLINGLGAPPLAVAGLAVAILVALVLILGRKGRRGRDL
jgi:TonB family protein